MASCDTAARCRKSFELCFGVCTGVLGSSGYPPLAGRYGVIGCLARTPRHLRASYGAVASSMCARCVVTRLLTPALFRWARFSFSPWVQAPCPVLPPLPNSRPLAAATPFASRVVSRAASLGARGAAGRGRSPARRSLRAKRRRNPQVCAGAPGIEQLDGFPVSGGHPTADM